MTLPDRPGYFMRLRFRLGVWLLKPHWLPLLEHYNEQIEKAETHKQREHCSYIVIGLKYAVGVTRWGRYK